MSVCINTSCIKSKKFSQLLRYFLMYTSFSLRKHMMTYITPQMEYNVQVSPSFRKFALYHFTFTKDPHQYLFLLTERNLKRIFPFRKNGTIVLSICFCRELFAEAVLTPQQREGTSRLFPQELHSAYQHQATKAVNCL